MRTKAIGLAVPASAIIAAGCGSSTESGNTDSDLVPKAIADVDVQTGPFDSDDAFVTAVSDYCKAANGVFARYPVHGVGINGLAAEFTTRVSDIRADDAAKPVLIGQNQIWSTYRLEANGEDYILIATHQPGSDTEYGVNAYWALSSANGGGGGGGEPS